MEKTGHIASFIMKLMLTSFLVGIAFGLYDPNPLSWVILFALIASILLHVVGDQSILPRYGAFYTTLFDAALCFLLVLALDGLSEAFNVKGEALCLFIFLLLVQEYLTHQILLDHRFRSS